MTTLSTLAGEPAPPPGSVLRLALAMRGGVSLAVWIGGAFTEIDRLRRAEDPFIDNLLKLTRFKRLEVDILAGASAGGLNAALGGCAIATGASSNLGTTWIQTADIDKLLTLDRNVRRRSLLNGNYFERELSEQIKAILDGKSDGGHPVEMFLATTILGGLPVSTEADPTVVEGRKQACFHFRHFDSQPPFSDLTRVGAVARVARAARSTAAYPAAFEPKCLESTDLEGTLLLPPGAVAPETLWAYDGGVTDNIPVARAIRAVAMSPAQEAVRRWVIYLQPNPGLPKKSSPLLSLPGIPSVLKDVVNAMHSETVLDDLEVLEAHNRESESQRLQRQSLCEAAFTSMDNCEEPRDNTASSDADYLYAMLLDPSQHLGWIPIGANAPASPIARLKKAERFTLRMKLLTTSGAQTSPVRPFARIVRLAYLLIEWIRWVETSTQTSEPELRRQVYDTLLVAQLVDAALDQVALASPGDAVDSVAEHLRRVKVSKRLIALADAIGLAMPDGATNDNVQSLRHRLANDELRDTLDELARGRLPLSPAVEPPAERPLICRWLRAALSCVLLPEPAEPREPVATLLTQLATVGSALLGRGAAAPNPSLFGRLQDRLGPEGLPRDVERHLLVIDRACAGLHRSRATGYPMTMNYARISGGQRSPLVKGATRLFGHVPEFEKIVDTGAMIDPKTKLSGNALASFSAFVSARFRANDWMWGRMDAAGGVLEILLEPNHLDLRGAEGDPVAPVVTRVGLAAMAPFEAVVDEETRRSAELVMESLWARNRGNVVREVTAAQADAGTPMERTQELLAVRWQLEIFLAELAGLLEQDVRPGKRKIQYPKLVSTAAAAPDCRANVALDNVTKLFRAYEECPRRVGAIWGQRRTTALGVKAARAGAHAVVPDGGLLKWICRNVVAAVLMVSTGALLARGAFLVAYSLLINLVLAPRLGGAARAAVVGGSLIALFVMWRLLVKRPVGSRDAWKGWVAGLVALGPLTVGIVGIFWRCSQPPFDAPMNFMVDAPLDLPTNRAPLYIGMAVVGGSAALAALLLWNWAKLRWIAFVTLFSGSLMALWVVLSAWRLEDGAPWYMTGLAKVGSMWFPAILLVFVTTVIATYWRPENR